MCGVGTSQPLHIRWLGEERHEIKMRGTKYRSVPRSGAGERMCEFMNQRGHVMLTGGETNLDPVTTILCSRRSRI